MQKPYRSEAPPQTSGLAISSLVLGILSCTLLGFVAGIPAIICGHLARKKVRISPRSYGGGGLAVAGLVLGYVGTAVSAILVPRDRGVGDRQCTPRSHYACPIRFADHFNAARALQGVRRYVPNG